MDFAGNPSDLKRKSGNLLAHALKAGACQVKKVFLKCPFQRAVVRVYIEVGKSVKVEGALCDGPHNGETFQLDRGISLLDSC